ncbi:hypothetical protein GCM10020219_091070 [Nonomuraea dietziae]
MELVDDDVPCRLFCPHMQGSPRNARAPMSANRGSWDFPSRCASAAFSSPYFGNHPHPPRQIASANIFRATARCKQYGCALAGSDARNRDRPLGGPVTAAGAVRHRTCGGRYLLGTITVEGVR